MSRLHQTIGTGESYAEWKAGHGKSQDILAQEEKGEAIRQSYINEYSGNGKKEVDISASLSIINAEKDIKKQSEASLKRGIQSLKKQIAAHKKKLESPEKLYPEWDTFSEQRQNGLRRHWEKEIRMFEGSIKNREEELKKRRGGNG